MEDTVPFRDKIQKNPDNCADNHKLRLVPTDTIPPVASVALEDTPSVGTGHVCQPLDGWKQPEGFDSPVLLTTVQPIEVWRPVGTFGALTPLAPRRNLTLLGKRAW